MTFRFSYASDKDRKMLLRLRRYFGHANHLWFIVLTIFICAAWGCSNRSESSRDTPSSTGSLSFQLSWTSSFPEFQKKYSALDCGASNVATVALTLLGPDQTELVRGGPWNCDFHKGSVTEITPVANCTALIVAADPSGIVNYRALVNDVEIITGQETTLGVIGMMAYSIVADAGQDQSVLVGTDVELDASGSYCLPDAPIVYSWTMNSAPDGSSANLTSSNARNPIFGADLLGNYTFSLVVSDGYTSSTSDSVTIYANPINALPLANAGEDQEVVLGQSVTLDGSLSSDPENEPLLYTWSMTHRPDGSGVTLSDSSIVRPSFVPDQTGSYIIALTVNDGQDDSPSESVTVTAVNTSPVATIIFPQDQSVEYLCDTIVLSGSATDDQDGTVSGNRLSWSSSLDGHLGNGANVELTNLTLGKHTITLSALDAHGESDDKSVSITVYYQRVVDTGQTQSFTDTAGEDSDYLINPFSYVDNDNGTISDNNTALMWQKTAGKTGGWSIAEAGSYCQDLDLGGLTDWRVPDRKELVSIISYWNLNSSINRKYFDSFYSGYLTTDECNNLSGQAIVDFGAGLVFCDSINNNQHVRCVRGGVTAPYPWTEGLVDNEDSTISDQLTGLMWQKEDYGRPAQGRTCEQIIEYIDSLTWDAALTYCQDLALAGHDDWRLPTMKELEFITVEKGLQTCFNATFFPHACGNYWSSTSYITDGGNAYLYKNYEGIFEIVSKNDANHVKCVRGGQ